MKKFITFVLTMLGLNSACSQSPFDNASVTEFAELSHLSNVQLLDVRTAQEYDEGHLLGAINIDMQDDAFISHATEQLDTALTVAVYCRSGRRSATAASKLVKQGFKVVNLKGGILAWQDAGLPTTTLPTQLDLVATPGGKMVRLQALMHASLRISVGSTDIEVDPVGELGPRTVDYSAMPKPRYILVTHEHGDHLDPQVIALLRAEGTRVITNERCAQQLGYGEVMHNGDALELEPGITLRAVPAYNTTPEHLQFHPKGRDNGFVLTIDGLNIYIAGDTEDIPEMANLGHIDVALLPCNQPYTMTPQQLVHAASMVKPTILIPYHFGKTDMSQLPDTLGARIHTLFE